MNLIPVPNLAPVTASERRTLGDLRAAPVRFKATAHDLGIKAIAPDGDAGAYFCWHFALEARDALAVAFPEVNVFVAIVVAKDELGAHEPGTVALCGPGGANDLEVAARVDSIARAAIARGVEAFRAAMVD